MAHKRNETTSQRVAKIASKGLKGKPLTKSEVKSIAGAALTQTADKGKRGGRKKR